MIELVHWRRNLPNDVRLQEGHPVDENLRPIKVGGKSTAIETAQHGNGAKINGDLTVTGDITGNIKDMVLEDVTVDSLKVINTVYFDAETANTIADGATGAIDWNTSQKQKVTITGTGITCNFTDPAGACNLLLKVVQGDGSDVIATWDGDIKWVGGTAPTLSTGNGEIDIISFYWDETNYFGVASLDFATP